MVDFNETQTLPSGYTRHKERLQLDQVGRYTQDLYKRLRDSTIPTLSDRDLPPKHTTNVQDNRITNDKKHFSGHRPMPHLYQSHLWNWVYDSLLRLVVPLSVLVEYVDDVAAVKVGNSPELGNEWPTTHYISRQRKQNWYSLQEIAYRRDNNHVKVKYLGVNSQYIDDLLTTHTKGNREGDGKVYSIKWPLTDRAQKNGDF